MFKCIVGLNLNQSIVSLMKLFFKLPWVYMQSRIFHITCICVNMYGEHVCVGTSIDVYLSWMI